MLEEKAHPSSGTTTETKTETNILNKFTTSPLKNLDQPKNALHVWYGRQHKGFEFCANKYFITWDDNGPSHKKYFTSIYRCPISGEMFGCGKLNNMQESHYEARHDSIDDDIIETGHNSSTILWYRKKKDAEHAAAARALDCLSYRAGGNITDNSYGLCEEEPYLDFEQSFYVPSSVPLNFHEWLESQPPMPDEITAD